jgi:RimJ/RimL family protein N-acetyltransferase
MAKDNRPVAVPVDFGATATLIDGATITIRCLYPDDYDAVVRVASELTSEERYQRFFTIHPAYIGEWALSLTAPAKGVVAIGAFAGEDLIGVANYAELPQSGVAEIAVVVAHEEHERGVGTLLLQMLGRIARGAGQHRFVADVLAENHAMRRVIREAEWPVTQSLDGAVISVELDLDDVDA